MIKDRADLNWSELPFGYIKTDALIRYYFKNGKWSDGELVSTESVELHIAATCLHYGQSVFEGLKVHETKDGRVIAFRVDEHAKRLYRSAEKLLMQPVPVELFIEAVSECARANKRFIPPYGTGASLYVRPILLGISPQIGVKPSDEYMFMVFVMPVGPYFKTGFKPINLLVVEDIDRAAPFGVGDVKAAGNYAAGLRASKRAKEMGFTEVLYLDAREKKYIDESGPANFFGITKDNGYVTPESSSILPSITNMSLRTIAKDFFDMKVEQRPVHIEEIFDFVEAGCCGTAAVITPVARIRYRDREVNYCPDGEPGPVCTKLYNTLRGIQLGEIEDRYGWLFEIKLDG
ncbi:MAG TPA: branched-chain amino acid aminotransferase [Proteobacteria bacterium]|nr:branched-chain amino acid aminotransferase [Pseudomonadota bacterium]